MLSITTELIRLASLALLLLAGLAKRLALLILQMNRLMMKRLMGSSQSQNWAILAIGLVWILGGLYCLCGFWVGCTADACRAVINWVAKALAVTPD
jgi:nitrate reductase gamma subunit